MMRSAKAAVYIAMAAGLGACTMVDAGAEAEAALGIRDTRAYIGTCIAPTKPAGALTERGFLAAIAAAILPSLIETGLDRLASGLRAAADRTNAAQSIATLNDQFNVSDWTQPEGRCIQIVRGRFSDASGTNAASLRVTIPNLDLKSELQERSIFLAEEPEIFIEARLRPSAHGDALAVGLMMFEYNKPAHASFLGGSTNDVVLSFAFSAPRSSSDDATGVVAQLALNDLAAGTSFMLPPDVRREAHWIPLPKTAAELGEGSGSVPIGITITISETRDANAFLQFLADVLEGSKEKLDAELQKQLIRTEKAKAKALEEDAQRQARLAQAALVTEAITRRKEADIAQARLDALPQDAPKEQRIELLADVEAKRHLANVAAENAGQTPPYDGVTWP